jgi:multisubunit Na+/H+ antiporter MnhG subunit
MRDAAITVLLVAGVAVQLLAVLGTVLMRDALDRLHYSGATVPALLLVVAAVFVRDSFSIIGNKAIALAVLVLAASPVVSHLTARAIHAVASGRSRR